MSHKVRLIRMADVSSARLETGVHQPGALAFYTRHGYVPCGSFGDYEENPLSVFLEKGL